MNDTNATNNDDYLYSTLLVADEGSTSLNDDHQQQNEEEEEEELQLFNEVQHSFEQHRRSHGSIIITDSDDIDSDTNTNSPSISDNEYETDRKTHRSEQLKLYLKDNFAHSPKYHYKKYKQHQMKKHDIQINYGNIHTKDIKYSLKHEERQRKREEIPSNHLINTTPPSPSNSLYPNLHVETNKTPISMIRTTENEQIYLRSAAKLHSMKNKVKDSLKRTIKKT